VKKARGDRRGKLLCLIFTVSNLNLCLLILICGEIAFYAATGHGFGKRTLKLFLVTNHTGYRRQFP